MKQIFVLLWLITPVGLLAFHYGPGQQHLVNDAAADQLREATELAKVARESGTIEDWTKAIEAYESALAKIPEEKEEEKARTRLAIARSRIGQGDLVQALIDLETLLDEEMQTPRGEGLEDEIRETLARDEYFIAWRMRLDGSEINAWRREVDNARRHFRYLAESQEGQADMMSDASSGVETSSAASETSLSGNESDSEASNSDAFAFGHDERLGKNLEASVRMMMMDLDMLRALPLPPEVQNSQGRGVGEGVGEQRGEGQGQGEGEGEGEGQGQGEGEGDARSRGATEGERPEGIGS
jgi:tetratricopeptide (TPR) repeat protein